MIGDFLKLTLTNLTRRRLRSWLTILGIVIGVAAIVSLIAVSQGMQNAVEEQFERFGTNIIVIRPGTVAGPLSPGEHGLTTRDTKIVEQIEGVDYAVEILYQNAIVEYHRQQRYIPIAAYPVDRIRDFLKETDYQFIEGGAYGKKDDYAVVLGYLAAKELFDDELHIRNRLYIEGHKFKIVGILEEIGNVQDDSMVAIPLSTARKIFNKSDEVNLLVAVAKEGVDVQNLKEKIEDKLEAERGKKDFTVLTATDLLQKITSILSIIQLIVAGIAAISLLVGAVGIMNTMYTSVLERTREIGIMKAIGATNWHIMALFMIESGIFGLVGGVIGVTIGAIIALGVGHVAPMFRLPIKLLIKIEPKLIVFGIGFAFVLGLLAGLLPARSAAKLKPAAALRQL